MDLHLRSSSMWRSSSQGSEEYKKFSLLVRWQIFFLQLKHRLRQRSQTCTGSERPSFITHAANERWNMFKKSKEKPSAWKEIFRYRELSPSFQLWYIYSYSYRSDSLVFSVFHCIQSGSTDLFKITWMLLHMLKVNTIHHKVLLWWEQLDYGSSEETEEQKHNWAADYLSEELITQKLIKVQIVSVYQIWVGLLN